MTAARKKKADTKAAPKASRSPIDRPSRKSRSPEDRFPFFNRELSWLAFNRRVLEQAEDDRYPLLERLRYIGFVCSNLDEFFEIRVSGLIQQVDSGVTGPDLAGLSPREQLRRIRSITTRLVRDQYDCWKNLIVPALRKEDAYFKSMGELTRAEHGWVKRYFEEQIFPVLTPLGIDPAHPFPQINNKQLNILVILRNPSADEDLFAVIPVPRILPRVVEVDEPRTKYTSYVFINEIIGAYARELFPGYEIRSTHAFRVTRNSDLYIDEEEVENLLQSIEEELHKMKKGAAVRLEIDDSINEPDLERLLEAIGLSKEFVFRIPGPLNLLRLMSVYDLIDRPDLKFPPAVPRVEPDLADPATIFDSLARKEYLLHHPFDSFTPVVDFIHAAARDPRVYAIKQTLYRTSGDSPIVKALIEASSNGKQVTALIELKARFDEANNIQWARQLEDAGVHVVYGLVGLKTHCKCCLIVRREEGALRRYAHLGTGNYNPKTARLYTDFSFFTANQQITEEVADLFNTLTGFARTPRFKKLLVAPFNLHSSIQRFIQQETNNAKAGKPARIIAKVNSLIDRETIENLYLASQAGVRVDLIVRGICGLVPGVRGVSQNIRVRSLLGRYLEHSRVFYFQNHGRRARLYVGSADWMPRNFFRRIESVFPVENTDLRRRIMETLRLYLKDTASAKQLRASGAYTRVTSRKKDAEPFSAQEALLVESMAVRENDAIAKRAGGETIPAPEVAPTTTPPLEAGGGGTPSAGG